MAKYRNHIVPQFYLRGFTNSENMLYCVRKSNEKAFFAHTKDICFAKLIYETPWDNGMIINGSRYVNEGEIEDNFMKMENEFSSILKSIIKKCILYAGIDEPICSREEYDVLTRMIVNFVVRNPCTYNLDYQDEEVKMLLEDEEIKKQDEIAKSYGMGSIIPIIKHVQKETNYGINEYVDSHGEFYRDLSTLSYSFLISKKGFITSDFPVIYNISNGFLIMAYLPLCANVAVVFGDDKDESKKNKCFIAPDELANRCNGQYLDYELCDLLISNTHFSLDDFPRVNARA